ncbi:serine/threonine-protein kinase [Aliterella atlantica]|uniref:Serine/threonine protein kinase n=1 Tax=Aliterella atlantica CENA595 TaxID=1618023 RepID=A0A0D8ZSZ7_9CYAN|nr:serine/threonine-protein kinase [Aliterella atlantica]KJH71487.1 serine/threonine protein kinase [Aliterella atlantica CENA595]
MSYCLNPACHNPHNLDGIDTCRSCGKKLSPLRNRYQIIRPLGGGGFGRTFLAEDRDKLNELCVVKQLVPQLQGTNAQKKAHQLFQQEARRLQQLGEHPQIPTLFAYFEEDDYLYLVQQLVVGRTLREELDLQGAFSEQKIWEILTDILPILQFTHDRHVIHRDLKPDNIMRKGSDGRLVLIDFGVSKQFSESAIATSGTTIGSFGYASSEQMNEGAAYPASDLYSLGVTCFHLLTNNSPSHLWTEYGYSWVKQWQQHLNVQISPELTAILDKLLQKDIGLRYQSVEQVWQDLRALPVTVVLPTMQVPFNEFVANPNSQKRDKSIQRGGSTTIIPANKWQRRSLLIGGCAAVLVLGFVGYQRWQGQAPTFMGHGGEVNTIAITADGKSIVSGSDDKTVKVWDLNSRTLQHTLKGHQDWVYSVAISPDSQTIVSGSKDNTIRLWNLATGKQLHTLTGHSSYVNSVAISPDSTTIASGSYDKTVKVWHLKTRQVDTLQGHSREVLAVAISPNGKKVVSGSVDRTIKIWDLATLKVQHTLTGHTGDVNAIAISGNNQELASVSDDKTIKLWNLNTGREIRTLTGHMADINAIEFSPDNQHVVTGSDDRTVKIWDLSTGEDIYTFKGHLGAVFAVAYSPDGRTVVSASADKTIRTWQVPN